MQLKFCCSVQLQKSQQRRRALEKVSEDITSKEEKANYAKALIPDMMSSEEEKENENRERYFQRKIHSFRDRKFQIWLTLLVKHKLKII